jgi:hypothetical protein
MHQDEQNVNAKKVKISNTGNVLRFWFLNGSGQQWNYADKFILWCRILSKTKNYMWQKIILIQEETKLWKVF